MPAHSVSLISPPVAAGHWARPGAWRHGPGAWRYGSGAWWPALPLLWLAVIVIAMTAVFLLIRSTANRPDSHVAEAKLAEQYATGSITQDEYRERLAVLRAHDR